MLTQSLRRTPLFLDVTAEALDEALKAMSERQYAAKEKILFGKTAADGLYIVGSGQVSLSWSDPEEGLVTTILGPGDAFGTGSGLTPDEQVLVAQAVTDVTAWHLSKVKLKRLDLRPAPVAPAAPPEPVVAAVTPPPTPVVEPPAPVVIPTPMEAQSAEPVVEEAQPAEPTAPPAAAAPKPVFTRPIPVVSKPAPVPVPPVVPEEEEETELVAAVPVPEEPPVVEEFETEEEESTLPSTADIRRALRMDEEPEVRPSRFESYRQWFNGLEPGEKRRTTIFGIVAALVVVYAVCIVLPSVAFAYLPGVFDRGSSNSDNMSVSGELDAKATGTVVRSTRILPTSTVTAQPATPVPPTNTPAPAPTATPAPQKYTVQQGDTLYTIADRYKTTLDAILGANPGIQPNLIKVGQELTIPVAGAAPAAAAAPAAPAPTATPKQVSALPAAATATPAPPKPTNTPAPPPPPTNTPVPPPTATPSIDFVVTNVTHLSCAENHGMHNIFFTVLDANGAPIGGVPIKVMWPSGDASVTTSGNGQVDFAMYPGSYTAVVASGSSQTASGMRTDLPDDPQCMIAGSLQLGNSYGHNSYNVTFKKTH